MIKAIKYVTLVAIVALISCTSSKQISYYTTDGILLDSTYVHPIITKKVVPITNPITIRAQLSGNVIIKIWVRKDGKLSRATIHESSHPIFNQPALDAVMQWEYAPLIINGEPLEFTALIPFSFSTTGKVTMLE